MRWPWKVAGGESQEQSEVCRIAGQSTTTSVRAEGVVYLVSGGEGRRRIQSSATPADVIRIFIPQTITIEICGCREILKGDNVSACPNPGHFTGKFKETFEVPGTQTSEYS